MLPKGQFGPRGFFCEGLPKLVGVADRHFRHAVAQGGEGIVQLRDHAFINGSCGFAGSIKFRGQYGNDGIVIVGIEQYAVLFKTIDQINVIHFGEPNGHGRSHGVGVGVEHYAQAWVKGQRSNDGEQFTF